MTAFENQPGARLARGVCRMLLEQGAAPMMEFTPQRGMRVDVMALGADGRVIVVECKTSLADFRADAKWPGYLDWCDAFYFAVPEDFPLEVLPEDEGVIVGDPFSGEIIREATARSLAPARRKALSLRFARAAAERLRRALDPGASALILRDGA